MRIRSNDSKLRIEYPFGGKSYDVNPVDRILVCTGTSPIAHGDSRSTSCATSCEFLPAKNGPRRAHESDDALSLIAVGTIPLDPSHARPLFGISPSSSAQRVLLGLFRIGLYRSTAAMSLINLVISIYSARNGPGRK